MFAHTILLQAKFAEARQVLGMTINYQEQFKELADPMAGGHIAEWALERRVLRHLWTFDEDMGKVARANRERTVQQVLSIFCGRGTAGDTTGNSPSTSGSPSMRSSNSSTTAGAIAAERIKFSGRLRTGR